MRLILLAFTGVSAGVLVSGGLFALLTKVGLISRMIACTKTADKVKTYERLIIIGGTLGNIVSIFYTHVYGGIVILILYGFMSGAFTGGLALALAESVSAIPVFMRKLKLDTGVKWIVLAFAIGKCLGSFLWFLN